MSLHLLLPLPAWLHGNFWSLVKSQLSATSSVMHCFSRQMFFSSFQVPTTLCKYLCGSTLLYCIVHFSDVCFYYYTVSTMKAEIACFVLISLGPCTVPGTYEPVNKWRMNLWSNKESCSWKTVGCMYFQEKECPGGFQRVLAFCSCFFALEKKSREYYVISLNSSLLV